MNTQRAADNSRIDATPATKRRRQRQRLRRACRCGADPIATIAEATVMQCMACEGIVHLRFTPGGPQPVPLTPPNPPPEPGQLLRNSLATPEMFSITGEWGEQRRQDD